MDWRERITTEPDILMGKPTVKGTRISVELVVGWLAQGWTHEQLLESYPHITRDDILPALAFAAEVLREVRYAAIPPQGGGVSRSALLAAPVRAVCAPSARAKTPASCSGAQPKAR